MKFLRKVIWINLEYVYNCVNIKNIYLLMLIKYLNLGFNKCMIPDIYWNFLVNITFRIKITENTTETYESLHKEYVKIPYYLNNKKNIKIQIMKTVSN